MSLSRHEQNRRAAPYNIIAATTKSARSNTVGPFAKKVNIVHATDPYINKNKGARTGQIPQLSKSLPRVDLKSCWKTPRASIATPSFARVAASGRERQHTPFISLAVSFPFATRALETTSTLVTPCCGTAVVLNTNSPPLLVPPPSS